MRALSSERILSEEVLKTTHLILGSSLFSIEGIRFPSKNLNSLSLLNRIGKYATVLNSAGTPPGISMLGNISGFAPHNNFVATPSTILLLSIVTSNIFSTATNACDVDQSIKVQDIADMNSVAAIVE